MSLVKTILTKIGFNNGSQPAINDTNLNQMQTNIQTAISTLETNIDTELGKIIESGSNSNGSYVKWEDGTMICRKKMDFGEKAVSNSWGSLYESEILTIGDYAQPFVEIPDISIMPTNTFFVEYAGHHNKTSFGEFWAARPVNSPDFHPSISCIAIGKWK